MTPGVWFLVVAVIVAGTVWRVCVAWERTHAAPTSPVPTGVTEPVLQSRPDLADPEPSGRVLLRAYDAAHALQGSCCGAGFRSLGRAHDVTCPTSPPALGSPEATGAGVPCCQTGGITTGERHDQTCTGGGA